MGPLAAAALPSAVAALGSFLGGRQQNEASAKESALNREFQERMSNTAYQRATQDMKLAGINPMLAYMQGGATSPGGSMATMQDTIGPAVSSAMGARRLTQELQNMRAQTDNIRAQEAKTWAENRLTSELTPYSVANAAKTGEMIDAQRDNYRANSAAAYATVGSKQGLSNLWGSVQSPLRMVREGYDNLSSQLRRIGPDDVRRTLWDNNPLVAPGRTIFRRLHR